MDAESVLSGWSHRSGEYSPGYYAYYGPNETSESIRSVLEDTVGSDASVLELGCSSGRHLSHLQEHGFEDLWGIEINEDAAVVMEESFPELAAEGTFFWEAIEDVITDFEDGQFDAVYSVETLQHIHHENVWVFDEISRITDEILITVEIEEPRDPERDKGPVTFIKDDIPLYFRNWDRVFTDRGFVPLVSVRSGRDRLRAFERRSDDSDR